MKKVVVLMWMLAGVFLGQDSLAQAQNLLVNGSFEEGDYTGGGWWKRLAPGSPDLTGWTIGGAGVDWHNEGQFTSPFDGDMVIDLNLDGGASGSISQTFTTIIGKTYALMFALAGPGAEFGLPDPRMLTVNVAGNDYVFSQPASSHTNFQWGVFRQSFQANATTTTVTFSSPDTTGFWGPVIDDVRVMEAIHVSVDRDKWYQLFKVGDTITIEARIPEPAPTIQTLDVKLASDYTNPEGVIYQGVLIKQGGDDSTFFRGEIQLGSDLVDTEKVEGETPQDFAVVEVYRDIADEADNYTEDDTTETSFGQQFLASLPASVSHTSLASANGDEAQHIPPATLEYLQAGGFETVTVEVTGTNVGISLQDTIFVRNQADWLIFTSHGWHSDGHTLVRNEDDLESSDIGGLLPVFPTNTVEEAWKEDLDGVLLYLCSVLDIREPGNTWVTPFIGPGSELDVFLGFQWTSPYVLGEGDETMIDWADRWLVDGETPVEAWHLVTNKDGPGDAWRNAVAIDIEGDNYCYWKKVCNILGRWDCHWEWRCKTLSEELSEDTSSTITGYVAAEMIEAGQTVQHDVVLRDQDEPFLVRLTWPGSDLDLFVTTPSGRTLDPTSDVVLEFYEGATEEYYLIESAEDGVWTIEIVGVDVDPFGEPYKIEIIVGGEAIREALSASPNFFDFHEEAWANWDSATGQWSNGAHLMGAIDTYLHQGYDVTLAAYTTTDAHFMTVWGYELDEFGDYIGIWANLEDDTDSLKLLSVILDLDDGLWYLDPENFYGYKNWFIGGVRAFAEDIEPVIPEPGTLFLLSLGLLGVLAALRARSAKKGR